MSQARAEYYVEGGPPSVISVVNGEKIIAWTTPHMRAERAMMRASELFSIGKREEGMAKIEESIKHMRDLLAILKLTPKL